MFLPAFAYCLKIELFHRQSEKKLSATWYRLCLTLINSIVFDMAVFCECHVQGSVCSSFALPANHLAGKSFQHIAPSGIVLNPRSRSSWSNAAQIAAGSFTQHILHNALRSLHADRREQLFPLRHHAAQLRPTLVAGLTNLEHDEKFIALRCDHLFLPVSIRLKSIYLSDRAT